MNENTHTMKPQIGERYWRRDGLLSGTIVPGEGNYYAYKDAATGEHYSEKGMIYVPGHERPSDLEKLYTPEGDELPDGDTVTLSGQDYREMKASIEMQKAMIERLRATVDRKNKIMSEIMDIVRDELAKGQNS